MRASSTAAFSIIELVVGLLLSSLLAGGALTFLFSVTEDVRRPVITYQGNNYSLAPILADVSDGVSKTDLMDALELHTELVRQMNSADMIAVFGGTAASAGAPSPPGVLKMNFSAIALGTLLSKSPASLLSVNQIAVAAQSELSGQYEGSSDPSDFTVITFSGLSDITCVAQVRRYTSTNESKAVALYETILRSRTPPSTTWATYAYRFWLPADEDNWAAPVGATHLWFRNESSWWGRHEPAAYTLVFPDPYVITASSDDATVGPASRFSYFPSVSPDQ